MFHYLTYIDSVPYFFIFFNSWASRCQDVEESLTYRGKSDVNYRCRDILSWSIVVFLTHAYLSLIRENDGYFTTKNSPFLSTSEWLALHL